MADFQIPDATPVEPPGVPGKYVVIGMFAFGILLTGLLWTYTRLHNAPFIPLRRALVAELDRSYMPRVEGGRHKGGPMTLRVVLIVDFDPTAQAENGKQVKELEERVVRLSRQHVPLAEYEKFELNLIQLVPESEPRREEIRRNVKDLL